MSLATVDRVLNARPGVREKTIAKVLAAVERLGYVRDTYAANLARQRQYNFVFMLPEGPSQFTDTLKSALKEAYASQIVDRVALRTMSFPTHDPYAIVRQLHTLDPRRLDGLAIMAPETPQVRDAIAHLKDEGLAIVAVASDLPNSQRDYFIGIDNVAAGRTAALLMGRFAGGRGEVLVVTNSMRSRDSLERRLGFDHVMASDFPRITVLPTVESYGDSRRLEEIIINVAMNRPNLRGLYSMGSGNGAVLNGLRRGGVAGELVFIAHDLTPTTRSALMGDEISAVIVQNVGHLVRSSLRVLRALCDDQPIFDAQERIRIEIALRENLS